MISNGTGLSANWADDWVGEWNLGAVDRFEPCDYEGVGGTPRPVRPQHGLVRDDPGDARAVAAADLLPVDPQLPLRPQLVKRNPMEAQWFKKRMSEDPDADPVVEDAGKPQMADKPPRPRRVGGRTLLMADDPPEPTRKTGRMDPLPKKAGRPKKQRLPLEEQVAPSTPRRPPADAERYLRIRVHLEDGTLSVQHIKEVEGPLVAHEDLHGTMVYEVTVGGERVASASVPDAGVNRAFPPREPVAGQEGHFFAPAPTHDILVRVPERLGLAARSAADGDRALPRQGGPPAADRGHRTARSALQPRTARGRAAPRHNLDDLPAAARREARRALK